ncbi:MAG: MYXO-CTERM sorting domain-containing protein [Nannocystaceae bacterium]
MSRASKLRWVRVPEIGRATSSPAPARVVARALLRRRRGAAGLGAALLPALLGGAAAAAPTLPGTLQNPLEDPEDCAECHSFANSADTKDQPLVAPIAWQGTLMANAARDPVFWAGVAIAAQDHPGETAECVRCHAPHAYVEGRGDALALADLEPIDRSGVDCDFCHRLVDDGETPPGNAHYVLDDVIGIDAKVPKRGPWSYQPGEEPLHSWALGDFIQGSRACGTCHDVTTPRERVDADGEPTGALFNEQRTFSEWRNSAYGPMGGETQSCQGCHMPAVSDVAGCGKYMSEGLLHASGGRRHDLGGGNRFMIDVLRSLYGNEGTAEVDDVFYDIAAANVDATLATAATLEVSAPAAVDLAAGLDGLSVTVTNESGHKLPTGYSEGRVMWIEVTATYADELVYSSGRWLDGEGPEDDAQLRRYEAIAVDFATDETFHLLKNNHWVVDSRLPPKGLRPDPETDPVGDRYALTADNVWPHYDTATYSFDPATVVDQTPDDPDDDALELRVRLLYLVNTPAYLEFLADANMTNSSGALAFDAFAALGGVQPSVLAEQTLSLALTGLTPPSGETTGGETTGASTSTGAGSTTAASSTTAGPSSTTAGSATAANSDDNGDDAGCSCRSHDAPLGLGGLLGLALALGVRRRRA